MTHLTATLAFVLALLPTGNSIAVLFFEDDVEQVPIVEENFLLSSDTVGHIISPLAYSGSKEIHIYLRAQKAFLTESGTVVMTYRISSGAYDTPTPLGMFRIYKMQKLRISSQAVPYRMPNYMAFSKNLAFGMHGLPYLGSSKEGSSYWKEALTHIGIPVSHGCVRFLPEDAEEIYAWAEVGVPVSIQK